MPFFKKKPVIIEAKQLTNENYVEIFDWVNKVDSSTIHGMVVGFITDERGSLPIRTLEGVMIASIGDWVIKGVNGEFYPCKPDIFEKSYKLIQAAKR